MIDTGRKILFIHIPKTAGTSITIALTGDKRQRSHRTLRHYIPLSGSDMIRIIRDRDHFAENARIVLQRQWDLISPRRESIVIDKDYFVFAVVRNPWARAVSWYEDVRRHAPHRRAKGIPEDISFESFLVDFSSSWALRPQTYWLVNWARRVDLDFVAKQENLDEDWPAICRRISVKAELPRLNTAGSADDWRAYYNDFTRDLVARRYREEIEIFGYRFA